MDKPQPPRRPMPRYDDDYAQAPVILRDSGTVSNVTNRVFEAYKINPVMIAMIVLLLTILAALGFYMMRNDDRLYSYIALRDNRERDLNDRLIEMALKCRDVPTDKSAYPSPNFPEFMTGGKAMKEPAKRP
jgi:hypothetical protein